MWEKTFLISFFFLFLRFYELFLRVSVSVCVCVCVCCYFRGSGSMPESDERPFVPLSDRVRIIVSTRWPMKGHGSRDRRVYPPTPPPSLLYRSKQNHHRFITDNSHHRSLARRIRISRRETIAGRNHGVNHGGSGGKKATTPAAA